MNGWVKVDSCSKLHRKNKRGIQTIQHSPGTEQYITTSKQKKGKERKERKRKKRKEDFTPQRSTVDGWTDFRLEEVQGILLEMISLQCRLQISIVVPEQQLSSLDHPLITHVASILSSIVLRLVTLSHGIFFSFLYLSSSSCLCSVRFSSSSSAACLPIHNNRERIEISSIASSQLQLPSEMGG